MLKFPGQHPRQHFTTRYYHLTEVAMFKYHDQ
jgi:hypothetical protein